MTKKKDKTTLPDPTAKVFVPHKFNTQATYLWTPRIIISPLAFYQMFNLVDLHGDEIGWLGTVRRDGKDFHVEEIFMFPQECHATTTEITPVELGKYVDEILRTRDDGKEIVEALKLWGHSHVKMDTNPSGQDNDMMEELQQHGMEWMIRAIANKEGKLSLSVFMYKAGFTYTDVPWMVLPPPPNSDVRQWAHDEIKENVTKKTYAQVGYHYPHDQQPWHSDYSRTQEPVGGHNAATCITSEGQLYLRKNTRVNYIYFSKTGELCHELVGGTQKVGLPGGLTKVELEAVSTFCAERYTPIVTED